MKLFQYLQHIGKFKVLVQDRDIADGAITTPKIADGAITTPKIADDTVTEEKLSQNLRTKIGMMTPNICLAFYTDTEPPTPLLMLSVRIGYINETLVPYLLIAQRDVSDTVTEWKWERESGNAALDEVWNSQAKARQRKLTLTDYDFPPGWNSLGNKVAFNCTASFEYEGTIQTLINVIQIVQ